MRRRAFITLLGGAAAWPITARAQQARLTTIGFLGSGTAAAERQWTVACMQRLRELGWTEGRNLAIEYRWAEGKTERLDELAAELVRLKVDVIVTHNTPPVRAAKLATAVIPIVFASAGDPVGTGLVANLARPGGNVTGLSSQTADAAGKRIELLREVIPGLRRLATLVDVSNPLTVLDTGDAERAARTVGVEVARFEIRSAEDIAPAFERLNGKADALYLVMGGLISANRTRIYTFALTARLPMIVNNREHVEAGALMSYGPNFRELFRRAAEIVDKILRGAKPADIPVEQPTKFDLVINLITAKALGLSISPMLVARADEVIE